MTFEDFFLVFFIHTPVTASNFNWDDWNILSSAGVKVLHYMEIQRQLASDYVGFKAF